MTDHKGFSSITKDRYVVYNPVFPDFENKNAVVIADNLTYEEALKAKEQHPEYTIFPQRTIRHMQ